MVKFSRKSISLTSYWVTSHDQPRDFYTSCLQLGESPLPMLFTRLILASMAVTILVWSLRNDHSLYYLVFLTNWGLILMNMMLLSGLLVSIYALFARENFIPDQLPWIISMHWFFSNVTPTLCLLITILYWTLIHDPSSKYELPLRLYLLDVTTHAFNSCLVIMELLLSRTPIYLVHFYQPAIFGLAYAIFSFVFYKVGGKVNGNHYIYDILDWRQPHPSCVIVAICFAGLLSIYACLCFIVYIRNVLSSMLRSQNMDLMQPSATYP